MNSWVWTATARRSQAGRTTIHQRNSSGKLKQFNYTRDAREAPILAAANQEGESVSRRLERDGGRGAVKVTTSPVDGKANESPRACRKRRSTGMRCLR